MAIPVCHPTLRDVHGLSWQELLVTAGRSLLKQSVILTAPEQVGKSFLAYLRPVHVLFPPLTVHVAFGEPFSLAKLVRLVAIPRTAGYSGTNFAQNLPQIVPIWVFHKISRRISW